MAESAKNTTSLKDILEALNKNEVAAAAITAEGAAGTIEANILASRAIKDIADDIAQSVAGTAGTQFVIWTADTAPSFATLDAFTYRIEHLGRLFDQADSDYNTASGDIYKSDRITPDVTGMAAAATLAPAAGVTIATLLSASAKVASYFQVESTFANLATTGVDKRLLAAATAGSLQDLGCMVIDPAFAPTAAAAESLRETLDDLFNRATAAMKDRDTCLLRIAALDAEIAGFKPRSSKVRKENAPAERALWVKAKATIETALKAYEALLVSLAAEQEEKVVVSRLIAERALCDLLAPEGRRILCLWVHSHGGGSETRKSIWSFLPTFRPFKVSAGVVASFAVMAKSGEIVMSDSIDSHAGYHGVGGIRSSVSNRLARIERRKNRG